MMKYMGMLPSVMIISVYDNKGCNLLRSIMLLQYRGNFIDGLSLYLVWDENLVHSVQKRIPKFETIIALISK